jgi:AraC-like DNA-binding protein
MPLAESESLAMSHAACDVESTSILGSDCSWAAALSQLEHSADRNAVLRHEGRDLVAARVTLTAAEGEGYWEIARLRQDLVILLANFAYRTPCFDLVPEAGWLQFSFDVAGKGSKKGRPTFQICRRSEGADPCSRLPPRREEKRVSICVRPDFLSLHFLASNRAVHSTLESYLEDDAGVVESCERPLHAQMLQLVTQLLDNTYCGDLYLINTEALILQLLCAAIVSLTSLPQKSAGQFSERELEAFTAAREILADPAARMPTLKALARTVGLPQRVLANGFKALYGETPFELAQRNRLEKALSLLRDQHFTVDRASEAAGYSHPTSFTAAFRRHFGLRPIDVKRVRKAQVQNFPVAGHP